VRRARFFIGCGAVNLETDSKFRAEEYYPISCAVSFRLGAVSRSAVSRRFDLRNRRLEVRALWGVPSAARNRLVHNELRVTCAPGSRAHEGLEKKVAGHRQADLT